MLNDFFYFWMSWMLWIIVTFFLKKQRLRTGFMCWILLTMIGSQIYLVFDNYVVISLAYLSIIVGVMILYLLQTNLFEQTIIIFIVTLSLNSLKIFLNIAPIWLIFSESLMVVISSVTLTLLLAKVLYKRIVVLIASLCLSEVLYNILLFQYFYKINIGDIDFLYEITLGSCAITVVHFLQQVRKQWMNKFKRIHHKKYIRIS